MRAILDIAIIVLRIWVAGFLLATLLCMCDFAFHVPRRGNQLLKRLALGLVWPLTMASPQGRSALFGRFSGT